MPILRDADDTAEGQRCPLGSLASWSKPEAASNVQKGIGIMSDADRQGTRTVMRKAAGDVECHEMVTEGAVLLGPWGPGRG